MRIIALVMSALLLVACSAVDDALEIGGEPIGLFRTDQGRAGVAINVGSASHAVLLDEVRPMITEAVEEEAETEVLIVNTANAAEAVSVSLPQSGKFELVGNNSSARSESAQELIDASMEAIAEALPAPIPSGSAGPADLFGSLERLSAWVSDAPEGEPQRVTLVTGGGIHRSTELDAVQSFSEGEALNGPALTAEEVDVQLIGIARFNGSDSGITTEFTDHIMQAWTSWCADATTKSCSINS